MLIEFLIRQHQLINGNPLRKWIGIRKIDDVWSYADNSTANYFNWLEDEPSEDDFEECVEIYADSKYNDVNCDEKRQFICEKCME